MVYLFLSTGVALVKTNCLCADREDVSFYGISDSDSNILSDHNCCEKSLPASENNTDNHDASCGCELPVVTYIKLTEHPGSDNKLEYPVGKTLCTAYSPEEIILSFDKVSTEVEIVPQYSPPEKPYGRILISFLNQRKIALSA